MLDVIRHRLVRKWDVAVRAVLVVAFSLAGCGERPGGEPARGGGVRGPRANIILLVIDALRADRMGVYGHPGGYSPTMDAVAAEGVTFERAIAPAPWTQPSVASLFCSRYPGAHRVLDYRLAIDATFRGEPKVVVFGDAFETLAEVLQRGGYATAGFVANPLVLGEYGFGQGFDHFDTTFTGDTTPGSVVNKAFLTWLEGRDANKPFFAFLHYMDVHGPYNAGPEFLDDLLDGVERQRDKHKLSVEEWERLAYLQKLPAVHNNTARHVRLAQYREYWAARYEAGVREVDHYIGKLREQLEAMGIWQGAYVIITADHGEALCEHGLWDHGLSVHHTDLHVPLILHWPGVLPAARRVAAVVRLIDVMPTILEELRLAGPEGMQGMSLVPYIAGTAGRDAVPAFAEGVKVGPAQRALYLGDWKLMVTLESGRRELFDLAQDAGEMNDLSQERPKQVEALGWILKQQVQINNRLARGVQVEEVPITPEQYERLRSLGYVQ